MIKSNTYLLALLGAVLILLAACGGTQSKTGQTVQGTLHDYYGNPMAYKTVMIVGKDPTVTDAEGKFTFEDVTLPYDLVIANASLGGESMIASRGGAQPLLVRGSTGALIIQGLAQEELNLTLWSSDQPHAHTSVNGLINPQRSSEEEAAEPTTNGVSLQVGRFFGSYKNDSSPDGEERYGVSLSYPQGNADAATLFALRWARDESRDASRYLGYYRGNVTLEEDASLEKDITLLPLEGDAAAQPLNISFSLPAAYELEGVRNELLLDGVYTGLQTAYQDGDPTEDGSYSFTFVEPQITGVSPLLTVDVSYELGSSYGGVILWRVSEEDVSDLEFPEPVVVIAPPDGGSLSSDMRFSWNGPENALYHLTVVASVCCSSGIQIEVLTAAQSVSLPDLSSLGIDLGSLDLAKGYWALVAYGLSAVPDFASDLSAELSRGLLEWNLWGIPYGVSGYSEMVEGGRLISSGL